MNSERWPWFLPLLVAGLVTVGCWLHGAALANALTEQEAREHSWKTRITQVQAAHPQMQALQERMRVLPSLTEAVDRIGTVGGRVESVLQAVVRMRPAGVTVSDVVLTADDGPPVVYLTATARQPAALTAYTTALAHWDGCGALHATPLISASKEAHVEVEMRVRSRDKSPGIQGS
ncbi:MAG TPA: hypothetical protein VGO93_22610 [Candidatus Xenobia bacterium]|jgi:hypothetical protein